MICLHFQDGSPIWINPQHIIQFYEKTSGGTRIVLRDNTVQVVRESAAEIMAHPLMRPMLVVNQ